MKILFLADQFADSERHKGAGYPGGAELSDAAAIEACPWDITTAKWREIQLSDLVRRI